MSLEQLPKEELKEMSMIDITYAILEERKTPIPFNELIDQLQSLLDLSDDEIKSRLAQFYTDVNIDGRFMNLGGNTWGISSWYPIEQVEDDIVPTVRTKKKKAKALDDDLDFDDIEEDDFDDLDDFDDEDLDEDEFLEEDEEEEIDEVEDDFDDDFEDEEDELLVEDEFEEDDEVEDELDEYIAGENEDEDED